MKGGCGPEAALGPPGQPVPCILGQVAVHLLLLLLLLLAVLQSVEAHKGQLSEERDRCKCWANSYTLIPPARV